MFQKNVIQHHTMSKPITNPKRCHVSPKLSWGKNRQSKLKTIDDNYKFSEKYNAPAGELVITTLGNAQNRYNQMASDLRALKLEVEKEEKNVSDYFVGALKKVEGDFMSDSDEYEKAGGIRKSKRKNPAAKRAVNKLTKKMEAAKDAK